MSYILEALRKSEQERNPQKVPDLATHHTQIQKAPRSKFPYWVILVIIILNGLFLLYMMDWATEPAVVPAVSNAPQPPSQTQPQVQTESQPTPVTKAETVPVPSFGRENSETMVEQQTVKTEAESRVVAEAAPVAANVQSPVAEPEVFKPAPVPEVKLDSSSVTNISDLNYDFQQTIPDMEFSTHVYVSGGGSFVIINGKSLGDGMAISRGLVIKKIVSDGIILEFRGRRFFLMSMTNWQPN